MRGEEGFFTYVPAPGENHQILEVPEQLEDRPFEDLPSLLRVDTTGPGGLEPKG